jgi:hypothetical protein
MTASKNASRPSPRKASSDDRAEDMSIESQAAARQKLPGWPSIASGSFAAVGVAWAAAYATTRGVDRDIGVAAWVAVAVVGASATIAAAVGPPRRVMQQRRDRSESD